MANPLPDPVFDLAPTPGLTGPRFAATPLSALAPGSSGVIVAVDTEAPVARRLLDLGFIPGSRVTVVRRAPLRDPVEYEVRGTRLCLRNSEASCIQVRSADGA